MGQPDQKTKTVSSTMRTSELQNQSFWWSEAGNYTTLSSVFRTKLGAYGGREGDGKGTQWKET